MYKKDPKMSVNALLYGTQSQNSWIHQQQKPLAERFLERIRGSGTTYTMSGSALKSQSKTKKEVQSSAMTNGKTAHEKRKPITKPVANIKPFSHKSNPYNNLLSNTKENLGKLKNHNNDKKCNGHKTNGVENGKLPDSSLESILSEEESIKSQTMVKGDKNNSVSQAGDRKKAITKDEENVINGKAEDNSDSENTLPSVLLLITHFNNLINSAKLGARSQSTSALWTPQKDSSSTTSYVFDFRGKEVKPNVALQPTSFGKCCAVRRSSIDGPITLNGSLEGDQDMVESSADSDLLINTNMLSGEHYNNNNDSKCNGHNTNGVENGKLLDSSLESLIDEEEVDKSQSKVIVKCDQNNSRHLRCAAIESHPLMRDLELSPTCRISEDRPFIPRKPRLKSAQVNRWRSRAKGFGQQPSNKGVQATEKKVEEMAKPKEVEANKVINGKAEDNSESALKPSVLLSSAKLNGGKSQTSSLWTQPKQSPSTTSIVFDFRGKDVKPNVALQPTPFGLCSAIRRSSIEGSITLNGSLDDDEDSNYTGSAEIPQPCGIHFAGENVKIGKGSLLTTRNKKLRLQFDDTAVSTYEYPSEASLLEDIPITPPSSLSLSESMNDSDNRSEESQPVIASHANSSTTGATLSTLKTNLALGGSSGGLSAYKPSLLETNEEPFLLGVSRKLKQADKASAAVTSDKDNCQIAQDSVEMLKPASPNETSPWSSSSTASDLLF